MKFLKNKVLIAFCTVALALTIFLSVFSIMGLTPYISGAVNAVCTPFQWCVSKVKSGFSGFSAYFSSVEELQKENRELKEEMQSLRAELDRQKYATEENVALRRYMHIAVENPSYRFADAQVIARESEGYMTVFKVDKGKKDGIEKDMNVMAGNGLVGIVIDVGPHYAKVRSIIDDTSKVSGMVLSTSGNCIVNGDLQAMNDNCEITFKNLKDADDKVKKGDQVVTSYVSDKFLQGILIGYVSETEMDSNNITKSGTITPAADFEHLREVLVILDKKTDATSDTEK